MILKIITLWNNYMYLLFSGTYMFTYTLHEKATLDSIQLGNDQVVIFYIKSPCQTCSAESLEPWFPAQQFAGNSVYCIQRNLLCDDSAKYFILKVNPRTFCLEYFKYQGRIGIFLFI